MMPVLSETAVNYTRTRYQARDYLFACPCTPVFRARVASVPTGNYLQIAYNTVSLGAYTDIVAGQTLIISATSTHTDYLYIGRVADTPTSGVIPINESDYPLSTSYYITVIDEYRELPRVRKGQLVDGRVALQSLPPAIKGLRSAYVLWSAGTASLSLSPVGQAMEHGETIASYQWSIPGVTYTSGSSSTQNITITVPQGHRWGRLTVTDSNGVSQWMVFEIFVQDPSDPSLGLIVADRLSITRNLNGHHCTVTAYQNVRTSDLLDGTRVTVATRYRYAGGDPGIDNVLFVGYLERENNDTRGPRDKSVTFDLAGLWERAGQLSCQPIAIRHSTSPAEWDQMAYPTPQRVIWHLLTRYSVFANLVSLDFDVTDNTWFAGNRNVSSNSLGDAVTQALDEYNAVILGDPSGEMSVRRWAFFLSSTEKNALDTIVTLGPSDMRDLSFQRPHNDPVGRVLIAWASFNTDGSDEKLGRAKAPEVTLGASPEVRELNNQLLPADLTDEEALDAAADRAGAHFAIANNAPALSFTGRDGFVWMTPSVYQWVPATLPSSLTARGRGMTNARHLLTSMTIDYEARGTHTVRFELTPEPGPVGAYAISNKTAAAEELDQIVVPPDPVYPGLPRPSSNTAPNTTTRGPFNPGSGFGSPLPPDREADAAAQAPKNGSRSFAIGLWVSTPVGAGFLTTLGQTYKFTVKGSGKVETIGTTYDFLTGTQGWLAVTDYLGGGESWILGEGWTQASTVPTVLRIRQVLDNTSNVTKITLNFNQFLGGYLTLCKGDYSDFGSPQASVAIGGSSWTLNDIAITDPLGIQVSVPVPGIPSTARLQSMTIWQATGKSKKGDAFYEWEEDADGNPINVTYRPGIKIDGAAPTPPLFSDSHEYTFEVPGTGNEFSVVYYDTDYADNDRKVLTVNIEGVGAGT